MTKPRVLYFLYHYPQISETYVKTEIEAVQDECDVRVVSLNRADVTYRHHPPFLQTDDPVRIREEIEAFRPHVLHTHWLNQIPTLAYFAGYFADRPATGPIPFTVRAHSFDVLGSEGEHVRRAAPILNSELCLGVLTFPFTRRVFAGAGVREDKVHGCYPVVNFRRFHDRSPNGRAVMNVGACLPKKQMSDFLELAARVPGREFNLYAMGYKVEELRRLNEAVGRPVNVVPPVEPEAMPAEYKKHGWLVYTAARADNTVGWPIAVAEAQASGVGVCVPNLRPDLRDYVGPAGFLYDSVSEVADIIRKDFPDELRQQGFEHAKKSDAFEHKKTLTALWQKAAGLTSGPGHVPRTAAAEYEWSRCATDWGWKERAYAAARELSAVIPPRGTFILADEAQLGGDLLPGSRAVPFLESDGQYAGPPADDDTAVRELERLRHAGASHFAFAWPAFWWLEHYAGLRRHLRAHFPCVLDNDRLVVFDLRP
jgi:glycosyltransferase involved in cell wall biosynthesis